MCLEGISVEQRQSVLGAELSARKRGIRSSCLAALRGARAQKGAERKQNKSKAKAKSRNCHRMSVVLSQGRPGLCRGRERALTIRLDALPLLPQFPHPFSAGKRRGRARCSAGTVPRPGLQEQLPPRSSQGSTPAPCRAFVRRRGRLARGELSG